MPYVKRVFDVTTFEQAKHVVLTSDPDNPKKFETETNFFVDVLSKEIPLNEDTKLLDFGCGMGRISKQLVDKFKCNIVGLDISESMLTFAKLYVANMKKFQPTTQYSEANSVDVCISVLALQHSEHPEKELENIYNVIKPGGYFVLLNEHQRFVPSGVDSQGYVVWNNDGYNIHTSAEKFFTQVKAVKYMNTALDIVFYRKD